MVRLTSLLFLGACTALHVAAFAMPGAEDGLAGIELEKRAKTVTRVSTGAGGKVHTKTITESKAHKKTTSTKTRKTTSTTSTKSTASPSSCGTYGKQYTDEGNTYNVLCGDDLHYANIHNATAATYGACFNLCSNYNGCEGFTYFGGSCYLKNAANPVPEPNGLYNSAALVGAPVDATGACPSFDNNGDEYIDSAGNTYGIACNNNLYQNDLSNSPGDTFGACFPICDSTPSCTGFTYYIGNCYLKTGDLTGTEQPEQGFNSAYFIEQVS